MCRWVQSHYGACQHQQTYVEEFCSKSTAVTTSAPHRKAHGKTPAPGSYWTPDEGEGPTGRPGDRGKGKSSEHDRGSTSSRPPPSTNNKKKKSSKHHRIATTSSEHSFTPIPEETAEDIASLEQQQQKNKRHQKPLSPRRFSEPAPLNMAGLAPFGKSTFRNLISNVGSPQLANPVTTTKNHNDNEEMKPDLNQQGGSFRIRQSGIREQFDESCNLPQSNETCRYLSRPSGGDINSSNVDSEPHRESSSSSDAPQFTDTASSAQDSIDAIERDLDMMKTEITSLRGAEAKQPPQMEDFPALPTRRSKIPVPQTEPQPQELTFTSRAAVLQARHERQEKEKRDKLAEEKLEREKASPERPPGAEQFPGLGTPSSTSSQRTAGSSGGLGTRKLSWNLVAATGMKAAVDKGAAGKRSSIGSAGASTVSASRTSRGSISSLNSPQQVVTSSFAGTDSQLASSEAGDSSVIISPQMQRSRIGTPSVGTVKPSQSASTLGKQSPRFAQPTQATARRVDETLRKDSAMSKPSPEGSPTKSTRTLTQSPKKRAPLPTNWTVSPESSPSKQSFVTAVGSIHTSPARSGDASSSPEVKVLSPIQPNGNSPEQTLRKKASSYMSPTKATTQRNIETLGQETLRQSPPRLSKAVAKIETNVAPVTAIMSPLENTPPLAAPLSGSTLASDSPGGFQPHNITERVMEQLRTGRPAAMADSSSTAPEGTASRNVSSSTASVFSPPTQATTRQTRRSTIGSPVVEMLAAKAKAAGFPQVANTTVQRRGSHGHLLTPIVKRLGKEGLLKSPESLPQVEEEVPQINPLVAVGPQSFPIPTPSTLPQNLPMPVISNMAPGLPVPPMATQPGAQMVPPTAPRPTVIPPHLAHVARQAAAQQAAWNGPNTGFSASAVRPPNSRTGSLRATAAEFKPMGQPQQVYKQADQTQQRPPLSYYDKDDWRNMGQGERDRITALRNGLPGGRELPQNRSQDASSTGCYPLGPAPNHLIAPGSQGWNGMDQNQREEMLYRIRSLQNGIRPGEGGVPHDTAPPANFAPAVAGPCQYAPDRQGLQSVMNGSPAHRNPPTAVQQPAGDVPAQSSPAAPSKEDRNVFITFQRPKTHVAETGAVLKPELNEATNAIQWFKESADGSKVMVHFGRGAAPDAGTPELSPTSNDTSPPKPFTPSPPSARRWRIGSLHDNKYGWKGGDGLEISFRGSGSNAERDPNPPSDVNFGHQQFRGSDLNNGARFIGGDKNHGSDSPPLAPRSREQWAKLMGHERVPCSTLNLEAREAVPYPPLWEDSKYGPFGFCTPCYPGYLP
ncbi:hypothetical protein PRZ48_005418 [Zasmidium cellare]|uniref:Uncharacterized protein n=1 Tax=Zasmidium cellare TaxID=395010 RepID=A0ABR0ESP2_ZASCE|nr:hypothetical protein PRZ48_005418 [Zasmidium cellare]